MGVEGKGLLELELMVDEIFDDFEDQLVKGFVEDVEDGILFLLTSVLVERRVEVDVNGL
jgi:hypothetical protein